MKQEHISEVKAIIILSLGMILLVSLVSFVPEDLSWYTSHPNVPAHNLVRITGAYLAGSLLFIFGYSAYLFVVCLLFWGWNKFMLRGLVFSWPKALSFVVLFCVLSALAGMIGAQESSSRFARSGLIGFMLSDFFVRYLGAVGSYIILVTLGTLSLILTGEVLVAPLFMRGINKVCDWGGSLRSIDPEDRQQSSQRSISMGSFLKQPQASAVRKLQEEELKKALRAKEAVADKKVEEKREPGVSPAGQGAAAKPAKPQIHIVQPRKPQKFSEEDLSTRYGETIVGEYRIPSLDLLEDPPSISQGKLQNTLMNGAKLLEETLVNFGVNASVVHIERGPAITRYELEPAPGVKVQKFTTLSDDIALAMRATTVRVVAPIPGKNRVGIEVPNADFSTVYLKEVLAGNEFRSSKSKLTLSLGKDIAGKSMVADLAEMPHLLIAGTTGSGKTVCVNGIIMSMIFNASPDEVKFVMVDPKMVELAQYNDIPHLLCPVVTDSQKASAALQWVVSEMETRYRALSKEGVRNLPGYNARGHKMPYIVVIIDELADLMQLSAKAVESAITRIAQLSRAVGIHLILATQRPSVDVITGVIKANFPARISFKVASKVDSRTVLDMNGAESLLGKGDMLFIKPGDAKPTRGQCSYVRDEEIQRVIRFIRDQQAPTYDESITKQQKGAGAGEDQSDEYYDEAVKLVIESNQASVSILQRRLRLGYTRAARLIDMMEQNGIVGPYAGSKPRDILVDREQWLLENMKKNSEGEGKA